VYVCVSVCVCVYECVCVSVCVCVCECVLPTDLEPVTTHKIWMFCHWCLGFIVIYLTFITSVRRIM